MLMKSFNNKDIGKAFVQVKEVLKHLNKAEYNKVPIDFRELIDSNIDKNYTWNYDLSKPLEEQDLSDNALVILAYINNEYLLTPEQKSLMNKFYIQNDIIVSNKK